MKTGFAKLKAWTERRVPALAVMAAFSVAIAVICSLTVWLGDDVDYAFFIQDSIWNSWGRLDGVDTFALSQLNHYMHVNGRTLAHALVQLFCGVLGQGAFAVCNGLVFGAFAWLLCRAAGVRYPLLSAPAMCAACACTVLVFVTKMVPTTQIGFMWMMALNLWWLGLLWRWRKPSVWHGAALVALGLLAGNGQEALTPGIAVALGVAWLRHRKAFGPWRTAAVVAYCCGTAAICLSPGTLSRAREAAVPAAQSALYAAMSLRAVYALVAVYIYNVCRRRSGLWLRANGFWLTALVVLLAMNAAIGVYSNRQLFGAELCALVIVLRSVRIGGRVAAVLAVAAGALMAVQLTGILNVRRQMATIEVEYQACGGGKMYVNRTRASLCPWLREFRYYEEIIGQYNNDTHHSLQKLLRTRYPHLKVPHVWPEFMRNRHLPAADTVVRYAPQHYFVVRADSATRFVADTHSALTGAKWADTLTLDKAAVPGNVANGYLIMPTTPFSVIDSVRIVH